MGWDLKPIAPTPEAPRDDRGDVIWGRYNISGWSWLLNALARWGINTSEFSQYNDGEVICDATCKEVANAIANHLPELSYTDREWLRPHIERWRTCGGYEQW